MAIWNFLRKWKKIQNLPWDSYRLVDLKFVIYGKIHGGLKKNSSQTEVYKPFYAESKDAFSLRTHILKSISIAVSYQNGSVVLVSPITLGWAHTLQQIVNQFLLRHHILVYQIIHKNTPVPVIRSHSSGEISGGKMCPKLVFRWKFAKSGGKKSFHRMTGTGVYKRMHLQCDMTCGYYQVLP